MMRSFGLLADGRSVEAITLGEPDGLNVEVLTYGAILRRLSALPASHWRQAVIDTPHRRHQRIRYLDETVQLPGYK